MFLLRLIWAVVRALFAKKTDLIAENGVGTQTSDEVIGRDRRTTAGVAQPVSHLGA